MSSDKFSLADLHFPQLCVHSLPTRSVQKTLFSIFRDFALDVPATATDRALATVPYMRRADLLAGVVVAPPSQSGPPLSMRRSGVR